MTVEQYADIAGLSDLTEVDRASHLAFYFLERENRMEFSASDAGGWFVKLGYAMPNTSRLADKLGQSRNVNRGSGKGTFRLHRDFVGRQKRKFPELSVRSQEIADKGTLLPEVLYGNTRGYIASLAKQINASYENNIFDGCAVLMRRLEEVLLILSYEKLQISDEIKDANGHYLLLEAIVRNAAGNATLNLSRNSRKSIETFRELGNYSAHKITYTCKREYIAEKIDEYRALVDELLHKSGLRV
jgi:hypothetical protein